MAEFVRAPFCLHSVIRLGGLSYIHPERRSFALWATALILSMFIKLRLAYGITNYIRTMMAIHQEYVTNNWVN